VGVGEVAATEIGVVTDTNFVNTFLDLDDEFGLELGTLAVQTVVLVRRLGKAGDFGFHSGKGLTERDNRLGDLDGATHEVFLEVLEANLKVELTSTANDVFAGLFGDAQNHRIGLGETLKAFDKLGEVRSRLGLDGNAHNRGHREFHGTDGVGIGVVADGTGLEEELVDTNNGASVTTRDVGNLLDVAAHHDDGTLDVLAPKVAFLPGT